jgi:hypothetical protein
MSSTITRLVAEAEALGGTPVRITFDETLETSARLRLARGGTHHWVVARPGPASDYFVANQLGVLVRILSLRPSDRFDFIESMQAPALARAALESSAGPESARDPEDWAPLATHLARWLLATVRSMPVAMRVDQQLLLEAPDLRSSLTLGLRQQNEENLAALSSLRQSLRVPATWSGPIAAFAIFTDRLLGTTAFTVPIEAMGQVATGRELVRAFDRTDASPSADRLLVDAWARCVGICDWYQWEPTGT